MTDNPDKPSSLPERALGPTADEFATAAKGAGEKLGEAGLILAEQGVAVAKTVRMLLAPVRMLVYAYELLEKRFIPMVQERINLIPDDRRTTPPLLIAGPAIEAAKFATDEPEICKLFANLLATSMDTSTRHVAHPSFVDLIKQLTPDEARILKYMAKSPTQPHPVVHLREIDQPIGPLRPFADTYTERVTNATLLGEQAGVERGELVQAGLDNLCRLGLCVIPATASIVGDGVYDVLENHPDLIKVKQQIEADGKVPHFEQRLIQVTQLGHLFIRACVLDRLEQSAST